MADVTFLPAGRIEDGGAILRCLMIKSKAAGGHIGRPVRSVPQFSAPSSAQRLVGMAWSSRAGLVAEHAVERPGPGIAVRLLVQTVRLKQIAQLPMGADDAECDLTRRQLIVEVM